MKINYKAAGTVAVLLVLAAGAFCFRPDAFWITDGGDKYLVMRQWLDTGSWRFADRDFFPDAGFHFLPYGGARVSVFPPWFSILSAPFWQAFGWRGLTLIPLLAGCGVVAMFAWAVRRMGRQVAVVGLAAALAFATPLAFYSWTFWEMTAGVVPVLAAFLLLKRAPAGAGAVLAVGLWMRPEMYFVAAALGAAWLWRKEYRQCGAFALGFFAAALPYWGVQYACFGHILGLHGASYHQHNAARIAWLVRLKQQCWENYFYYWGGGRFAWAAFAALLTGWIWRARFAGRRVKSAVLLAGAAWSMYEAWRYWGAPEPVIGAIWEVGLFTSLPFMAVWAMALPELLRDSRSRFWAVASLVYTVLLPPLLTANDLGIIWGPRHYLVMMPVYLGLAWYGAQRLRLRRELVILLAVGVCWQAGGWRALALMKENAAALSDALARGTGQVVASDVYFLPGMASERFRDRTWLYWEDDAALERFLSQPRSPKHLSLVVSRRDEYRKLSNEALQKLLTRGRIVGSPRVVTLPGTRFLEIAILDWQAN